MNLHSITAGITIPIPIPDLGYSIFAYIERVEPADTSLIIEGEVNVEFINDFEDAVAERVAAIEDVAAIDEVAAIEEVVEEEKKVVEELTPDQRKAAIRESWSKRF
jgi:hypothetical protein